MLFRSSGGDGRAEGFLWDGPAAEARGGRGGAGAVGGDGEVLAEVAGGLVGESVGGGMEDAEVVEGRGIVLLHFEGGHEVGLGLRELAFEHSGAAESDGSGGAAGVALAGLEVNALGLVEAADAGHVVADEEEGAGVGRGQAFLVIIYHQQEMFLCP